MIMANDGSDNNFKKSKAGPFEDSIAKLLNLEGYPKAPIDGKSSTGGTAEKKAGTTRPEILVAAREIREREFPEYFAAADKRLERQNLLDDQLMKLYRPGDFRIQKLKDAFNNNYDAIAPALDSLPNSVHFKSANGDAQHEDLLRRQDLMEWVNRAAEEGRDNSLMRLSLEQQAALDTLEKVRKPEATATPAVKDSVQKRRDREEMIAKFKNNVPTPGKRTSLGTVGGYRPRNEAGNPLPTEAYIQAPDKPAKDNVEGVLTNSELHYVHDSTKRLAQLNKECRDLQLTGKKPSTNDPYAKLDAEREALDKARNPRTLTEALGQAQLRALLIRQYMGGLGPEDTYLVRRLNDGFYDSKAEANPLKKDTSKIPGQTVSIIDGTVSAHHVDDVPRRLKSVSDQCQALRSEKPSVNHKYWALIAERDALDEFRGKTADDEAARALRIKKELIGLDTGENMTLRQLRDKLHYR